ncbi:unnamed protein product [Protopolystoma xenopodis]|uniref:Uncharacterized protein n=1 Tax=Protopolystoma xenopodis TaxID=117903 RepID=A0A3S4ZTI2_9PLAT|nr:unnamed protein product [Protopolystoma xenopodis]
MMRHKCVSPHPHTHFPDASVLTTHLPQIRLAVGLYHPVSLAVRTGDLALPCFLSSEVPSVQESQFEAFESTEPLQTTTMAHRGDLLPGRLVNDFHLPFSVRLVQYSPSKQVPENLLDPPPDQADKESATVYQNSDRKLYSRLRHVGI